MPIDARLSHDSVELIISGPLSPGASQRIAAAVLAHVREAGSPAACVDLVEGSIDALDHASITIHHIDPAAAPTGSINTLLVEDLKSLAQWEAARHDRVKVATRHLPITHSLCPPASDSTLN